MTTLPFATSVSDRTVAEASQLIVKNRFFEQNPALNDSPASAISRPTLKKFTEIGTGPVRKLYSQSGLFNDALFAVSGTDLYKIDAATGADTLIGTISSNSLGDVSMASTAPIGTEVPAYLFIAEGGVLWVYTDNGQALGHLTASSQVSNGDVVRIDSVYYQFVTSGVDTGSPAGTVGNPWLVLIGANSTASMYNLYLAINALGTAGTTYSTALTAHATVSGYNQSGDDLYVVANVIGTAGNAIVTTETSATLSWAAATLENGGSPMLRQVLTPDDVGAISLAHINSYVIVVPTQDAELAGRFYWINPGEIEIDPLDYATAERSPDKIHQVVVFGEMFWLCGQKTTEPWITTGDLAAPMSRFSGILFDRGSWEGTAIQVKDSLIVVDEDGGVFQIANGQKRISTPAIEEKIRRAILNQAIS